MKDKSVLKCTKEQCFLLHTAILLTDILALTAGCEVWASTLTLQQPHIVT
jgi:hypothetical protein